MRSRKSFTYLNHLGDEDLQTKSITTSPVWTQRMYLSEMELHEVNKHAMTFGYIPEFNSIRYNYLKLRRLNSMPASDGRNHDE